jgi:N-acetylmuramoyl-L-alanine amidase
VLKGTLAIRKQQRQDRITSTYTYTLKNADKSATLSRVLSFTTTLTTKDNGQIIEETAYSRPPTETFKIGSTTYSLKSNDFTRSSLVDPKPAINYFAGNIWGRKVYQTGTAASGTTVTVESTGNFYGYDGYWGTAEVEVLNYTIESEQTGNDKADKWGGTARVTLSSTVTNQLKYYENQPDQISFEGGYVQSQYNNSVLEYTSSMPEFDAKGIATDNVVTRSDSLKIETFPVQKRLPAVDLSSIRGHWAEEDLKLMYGLEVFRGDTRNLKPDQYITKAEFAAAIVQAAKEVPPDPALTTRTPAANQRTAKQTVVSPFDDVSIENMYFDQINDAYKRGLLSGKGKNLFGPNDTITVAEAVAIFVRAIGLESLAPSPQAVTNFRDNDLIPPFARNSAYVAEKIGLVQGDERGYLRPGDKLTKARTAVMLKNFVTYMQDGIKRDYRDRIVNY